MKKIFLIAAAALLAACSSTVSTKLQKTAYTPFGPEETVYILNEKEQLPPMSALVGNLKIGDSGFSKNCGYNQVMETARAAARKTGANVIKITELREPSFAGSTCYRIIAKMYRNTEQEWMANLQDKMKAKNQSRLPEDADYAVVYFYRPAGVGFLLGYKVRTATDSIIGRLRADEKFAYKTKKFGPQQFVVEVETKESITLNIEKGKEYFVRCGMTMGVVAGRPEITLIDNEIGIKEYNGLK